MTSFKKDSYTVKFCRETLSGDVFILSFGPSLRSRVANHIDSTELGSSSVFSFSRRCVMSVPVMMVSND
jgi:hypothetical protein